MEAGSILAVHSAYAGGREGLRMLAGGLARRYELAPLEGGVFESRLVPLLPDIMEQPLTHQNPLAWLLRYRTQYFRTELYLVKGPRR